MVFLLNVYREIKSSNKEQGETIILLQLDKILIDIIAYKLNQVNA